MPEPVPTAVGVCRNRTPPGMWIGIGPRDEPDPPPGPGRCTGLTPAGPPGVPVEFFAGGGRGREVRDGAVPADRAGHRGDGVILRIVPQHGGRIGFHTVPGGGNLNRHADPR